MGSALNSVMGGGGGGLLGSIGGIVGGIFGGPIGAMIGQAVGGLLQNAIGDGAKSAVDQLQKEDGMPKFLADQAKEQVDSTIDGMKNHDIPKNLSDDVKSHIESELNDISQAIQDAIVKSVRNQMGGGDDSQQNGGSSVKGGGTKPKPSGVGWLQAIAQAMGECLGEKASELVDLSNRLSELNSARKDNTAQIDAIDKNPKINEADKKEQEAKLLQSNKDNAQESNELMTQFQATNQEYSMLNNVFSTAIKALGESLSSMARKQ